MLLKRFITFSSRRLLALLALAVLVMPFIWLGILSVQNRVDALVGTPKLLFTPVPDHYIALFTNNSLGRIIANSFVVAIMSTFLAMVTGVPLAYWISRSSHKWGDRILTSVLAFRLLPAAAVVLPLYLWMQEFNLIDSV